MRRYRPMTINLRKWRALLAVLRARHLLAQLPASYAAARNAGDIGALSEALHPRYEALRLRTDPVAIAEALPSITDGSPIIGRRTDAWLGLLLTMSRGDWKRLASRAKEPRIAAALSGVLALFLLVIAFQVYRAHSLGAWEQAFAETSGAVPRIRSRAQLLASQAGGLPALPAGVHVHALNASRSIAAALDEVRAMHVWADDHAAIVDAYHAATRPLDQLVAEDQAHIKAADADLDDAKRELAQAQLVVQYANKWGAFESPSSVPIDLVPAWNERVAAMHAALAAGDPAAITRNDLALERIKTAGPDYATLLGAIAPLPPNVAGPLQEWMLTVAQALASDAPNAAEAAKKLRAASKVAGLAYQVRLVNRPGVLTGVERATDGGTPLYYIVVQAVDMNGVPLRIPVLDAETEQYVDVDTYAVQVPPEVYASTRERKMASDVPLGTPIVGAKPVGQLVPTYTFPTLARTITSEKAWTAAQLGHAR